MRATHEHEFEAALGLPEELPTGEQILWQGAPNWISLGVEAFHLRSLGIYFGLMLLLQLSYLYKKTNRAADGALGRERSFDIFSTTSSIIEKGHCKQ